jgi:hypothetical protein
LAYSLCRWIARYSREWSSGLIAAAIVFHI